MALYGDSMEANRRYLVGYKIIHNWLVQSVFIGDLSVGDIVRIDGSMEAENGENTTIGISGNLCISSQSTPAYEDAIFLYGLSPGNLSNKWDIGVYPHYTGIVVPYSFAAKEDAIGQYIHLFLAIGTDAKHYDPNGGIEEYHRQAEVKRSSLQALVIKQ